MTTAALDARACCARAYSSDAARFLLGESFHPGGLALTDDLARALRVGPGDVVVDLACGNGASAARIAAATGCSVIGVDVAEGFQRAAGCHFVRGDAHALPVGNARANGIVSECAFCLFADKAAAAREIARVLRRGARLALSDVWADPARLPEELRSLDGYVACLGAALPLELTAMVLGAAGLTVERIERRDEVIAPLLERIDARLRVARLIGGGPLAGAIDRAEQLLAAAGAAVRAGLVGYGVVIARRG